MLNGGLGKDRLIGGLGADMFKLAALADSGATAATRDAIIGFELNRDDRIDVSAIDADTAIPGNQVFASLTMGGTFSGVFANPGELYLDESAAILYGNTDSAADFSIKLVGVNNLSLDAFVQ